MDKEANIAYDKLINANILILVYIMASKISSKDLELDDLRLLLHKRGSYLDQLVRLFCEKNATRNASLKTPLIDCIIVVALQKSEEVYSPFVKMKYPPDYDDLPFGFEMFCFPDAEYWSPDEDKPPVPSKTYSLVLTKENGTRKFGYCTRIIPEGGGMVLPLAYCIISSQKSRIYPMILRELEAQHGADDDLTKEIFRLLHAQSFPATVNEPIFISHSGKIIKQIKRPMDSCCDHDLIGLFKVVGIDGLIEIFHSILLERKIIILGAYMEQICDTIDSLVCILSPFAWQHTLIPLLPSSLIHILEAPTPYIIGMQDNDKFDLSVMEDLEDVMIVDLDYEAMPICKTSWDYDEAFMNCESVKCLIERLEDVETVTKNEYDSALLNVMITEAFTKFFLAIIGDCSKYIKSSCHTPIPKFERQQFLNSATLCRRTKEFLATFTQTAMFNSFIFAKFRMPIYCTMHQSSIDNTGHHGGKKKSLTKRRKKKTTTTLSSISSSPEEENFLRKLPIQSKSAMNSKSSASADLAIAPKEITVHLNGHIRKILQVDIDRSVGYIQDQLNLSRRLLMAKNSIPISPTANIGDVHQIFKDYQGVLHLTVA